MKVPGIAAVYTWEDVPAERFTMAGQTYRAFDPADPGPAWSMWEIPGGHCGRGDRGRRRPGLKAGEGVV